MQQYCLVADRRGLFLGIAQQHHRTKAIRGDSRFCGIAQRGRWHHSGNSSIICHDGAIIGSRHRRGGSGHFLPNLPGTTPPTLALDEG